MLQQTQVATVIPYFYRFIATFPTLSSLAQADSNQVLALWSGLGYYARARNLHRTAQIILSTHAGVFPQTLEALVNLPGIGRSTAGAIIAQSFNAFGVILDGNVKRVLTRYLTLKPSAKESVKAFEALLWAHAEYFTPKLPKNNRVADYTQAIMDLGATICTRTKPSCSACPLSKNCQANLTQSQLNYPVKPAKKIKPIKQVKWLVLVYQPKTSGLLPQVLLSQRPSNGIWGGLWSFPEYPLPTLAPLLKKAKKASLGASSHTFTHFKLEYEATLVTLTCQHLKILASQKAKWYNPLEITQVGLPSPITKILNQVGFFKYDNKFDAKNSLLPKTQTRT